MIRYPECDRGGYEDRLNKHKESSCLVSNFDSQLCTSGIDVPKNICCPMNFAYAMFVIIIFKQFLEIDVFR